MLFEDERQLEIRHVIALAHYVVDVYAGGEDIPEGELFIKRNCIRLRKRQQLFENDALSAPFYLFCDNAPRKEDLYLALLRAQRHDPQNDLAVPAPIPFETDDMIKLIRQLHVSEENKQTRWLNAFIGRLFLALYKTNEVESHIRQKIEKKISRVAKPAIISSITLQDVSMGDSGPSFMNPKLREMTVDGALTIEADVRYSGNFKAVIGAVARLELGPKLKAREVSIVIAGVLKRLEGHVLFKIKPPPSNRIWFSFETMPKLDVSLEPVVSSRQITYGVVLRPIVTRIHEVIAETLVYPNWDDVPFLNTEGRSTRGGVWKYGEDPQSFTEAQKATEKQGSEINDHASVYSFSTSSERKPSDGDTSLEADSSSVTSPLDTPTGPGSPASKGASEPGQNNAASLSSPAVAQTSGAEKPPKAMRSHSFASAATPVVSKGPAGIEGTRRRSKKGQKDAASTMQDLASRSPDLNPSHTPSRLDVEDHDFAVHDDSPELLARELQEADEGDEKALPEHHHFAHLAHHKTEGVEPEEHHHLVHHATAGSDPELHHHPVQHATEDLEKEVHHLEHPLHHSTEDVELNGHHHLMHPATEPLGKARDRATSMNDPGPSARSNTAKSSKTFNQSLNTATSAATKWGNTATNAATKWGLGVLNMHDKTQTKEPQEKQLNEPMGRGQPLPPPGVPLPKPEKGNWGFNSLRRKPVAANQGNEGGTGGSKDTMQKENPDPAQRAATQAAETRTRSAASSSTGSPSQKPRTLPSAPVSRKGSGTPVREKPATPSPRAGSTPGSGKASHSNSNDDLLTISAPSESAPSTPRPQTPDLGYVRKKRDNAFQSPTIGGWESTGLD